MGSNSLTLGGSNTYSGVTLVGAGSLVLANTAALSLSTFDASGAGAQFRHAR